MQYRNQAVDYKRKGEIWLLCQDLEDITADSNSESVTVSEFRFNGDACEKLEERLQGGAEKTAFKMSESMMDQRLGEIYHRVHGTQEYFDIEAFTRDCEEAEAVFSCRRKDYLFLHPKVRGEDDLVIAYLRQKGFILPREDFQLPGFYTFAEPKRYAYWPLRVDLKTRKTQDIIGITCAAGAASGNVLLSFEDFKRFDL